MRTGYLAVALAVFGVLAGCYALHLDTFSAGSSRALRLVQLGLVSGVCAAAVLAAWWRRWPAPALPRPPGWSIALAAFAAAAAVALAVLQSVPLSGDEGAYVYQADLFAHGLLWAEPSSVQSLVSQAYIFPFQGKLISQYPPGWPAVLSLAAWGGLPLALVNPVLGALAVAALYHFARLQHGREVALLAAAGMAATGFFLFNSGSFYNGSLTALLGILFAHAAAGFIGRPSLPTAIGTGLWFSALAIVRHYDAVLFALPVAVALLPRLRPRHLRLAPAAVLAAAPLLALLLLYYWCVTGDPLLLPQKLQNPNDGLLGANWHALRVTEILVGRVVELAEWVSPAFVVAFGWALVMKLRTRSLRFYDLYGPVFLAGYWLFWADGTLRYGPRYIYPALPFMVLPVAERAWAAMQAPRKPVFAHLALVAFLVAALQVPFLAARGREMITQTQDLYHEARRAGLRNAVVLIADGTGLIWRIDVGDLARNGRTLDGPVLYAHGPSLTAAGITPAALADAAATLRARFPDRDLWVYRRDPKAAEGRLTRE